MVRILGHHLLTSCTGCLSIKLRWRLPRCCYQCRRGASVILGTRSLPIYWSKSRRCHHRSPARLADRCGRHRANSSLCPEWRRRCLAGKTWHPRRFLVPWCGSGHGLRRPAVCRTICATGVDGSGASDRRSRHCLGSLSYSHLSPGDPAGSHPIGHHGVHIGFRASSRRIRFSGFYFGQSTGAD